MTKRKAEVALDESSPPSDEHVNNQDENKQLTLPDRESKFLAKLMERHMHAGCGVGDEDAGASNDSKVGASYETLRVELGIGERVKSQIAAWKALIEGGYIEVLSGKEYSLTRKGLDYAATPEYKEYIKDLNVVSLTNEDHQARIIKYLKPQHKKRAKQIIEWLTKYGSLTAVELAALIVTKRGSHAFSDGLSELKKKGYIVVDPSPARKGKLLCLADKVFLNPKDRPDPEDVDTDWLAQKVEDNADRKKIVGGEKTTKSKADNSTLKSETKVPAKSSVTNASDEESSTATEA